MAQNTARVRAIETIAADTLLVSCAMESPATLPFRAGQFITVFFGGPPLLKRSYSLASSPSDSGHFDLVVKLIPEGAASTYFASLAPGAELHFLGPLGFFTADPSHPGDIVFAATGSGLTPVLPMLREILARPSETGRVHLFHGVRHESDLFWLADLAALAAAHPRFTYSHHLTRPSPSWPDPPGRITAPVLSLAPTLSSPTFYLVGNGAMIRDLKAALIALGFDRKRHLRSEIFHPA